MLIQSSTIILILISIFASEVYSACSRGPLTSLKTKFGTDVKYCEYEGMKMLPGSTLKLSIPQCIDCRCTLRGLECCGFGFAGAVARAPEGCARYNDACQLVFVKSNNESELCAPAASADAGKKATKNKNTKKNTN